MERSSRKLPSQLGLALTMEPLLEKHKEKLWEAKHMVESRIQSTPHHQKRREWLNPSEMHTRWMGGPIKMRNYSYKLLILYCIIVLFLHRHLESDELNQLKSWYFTGFIIFSERCYSLSPRKNSLTTQSFQRRE